ncbi:MAG TPA: dihydrofolate reductase, partial [Bacteroidia bacterium]|nr:dihydrofolate reductase [Bacteroidia bacterium]
DNLVGFIIPIIFDTTISVKKVQLDPSKDLVLSSAVNFYEGVNQAEVTSFYEKQTDKTSKTPVMQGLNSKLVKEGDKIVEK